MSVSLLNGEIVAAVFSIRCFPLLQFGAEQGRRAEPQVLSIAVLPWTTTIPTVATPTNPSPYITPLIDQLLGPLCEAASHLSPSPQQALVEHTVTLLLYELRKAILNCRHQLQPVTCRQLQVDLDQLIFFLVSADSRLEQQTRELLGKLPVCVDMKKGLGALAREERIVETSSLSVEIGGELGRLLNQVTLLNNIVFSELDWK